MKTFELDLGTAPQRAQGSEMQPAHITRLSLLLWEYYDAPELLQLVELFGVSVPESAAFLETKEHFLGLARSLIENIDQGNTRALLDALLENLDIRNTTAIANTGWERRTAHESLSPILRELGNALEDEAAPSEIAVPAQRPFAAKSAVREFLEQATTTLLLVDPYIGVATLDCLRLVNTPIRLLTASASNAIEAGFSSALVEFEAEGRVIEVRQAPMLHDRHLAFNDRCWLVGSSLKDAGKKAFNCTEIVDSKAVVLADLEKRWSTATPYP